MAKIEAQLAKAGAWIYKFELQTEERSFTLHARDRSEYELWVHVFVWIIRQH